MEPETDTDERYIKTDWQKQLLYRHSTRGHVDRKIDSLRRRGKKKYLRWGLAFGLVAGAVAGLISHYILRLIQ